MHQTVAPVTCMRGEIDAADKELDATAPVPRVTQHAVELVGGTNIAVSQIGTISSTYLQPFKTFNKAVGAIAHVRLSLAAVEDSNWHCPQIHPYTQMALGVLTSAAQVSFLVRVHTSHIFLVS